MDTVPAHKGPTRIAQIMQKQEQGSFLPTQHSERQVPSLFPTLLTTTRLPRLTSKQLAVAIFSRGALTVVALSHDNLM